MRWRALGFETTRRASDKRPAGAPVPPASPHGRLTRSAVGRPTVAPSPPAPRPRPSQPVRLGDPSRPTRRASQGLPGASTGLSHLACPATVVRPSWRARRTSRLAGPARPLDPSRSRGPTRSWPATRADAIEARRPDGRSLGAASSLAAFGDTGRTRVSRVDRDGRGRAAESPWRVGQTLDCRADRGGRRRLAGGLDGAPGLGDTGQGDGAGPQHAGDTTKERGRSIEGRGDLNLTLGIQLG